MSAGERPAQRTERLAGWLLCHRSVVLVAVSAMTLFFLYHAVRLRMETHFEDLLPKGHPYVTIYERIRDVFGGANVVMLAVTVKEGDIFRPSVLQKIRDLTQEIDLVPGVNHHQVISIAHRKVKDFRSEASSIAAVPVMWPKVPTDAEQIDHLKQVIHTNDTIHGPLVSLTDRAALISAALSEGAVNYRDVFERVMSIAAKAEDAEVTVQVVGEPILYGWIYHYVPQTYLIFAVTVLFIVLLLYLYFGQLLGTLRPFISGVVSAIWGLGFMEIAGFGFEPLLAVIPFLITARAVSHSVQMMERYFEEYELQGDVRRALISTFSGLCAPTLLGVVTDALGILIVLISPMPILHKLAITGAFWVSSILVSELILNLIVFSYLPPPQAVPARWRRVRVTVEAWLGAVARLVLGSARWATLGIFLSLLLLGGVFSGRLTIGDVNPGSPLLWSDSRYNADARTVNSLFPGADQLIVVARAEQPDRIRDPQFLQILELFQMHMEEDPNCGGTQSIVDILRSTNMALHEGDPKWRSIPGDKTVAANMLAMVRDSSEPGDLDRLVDYRFQQASLIAFYKDHRGATLEGAIARAKDFIERHPMEGMQFELAGGLIGVLAAANEEIGQSQTLSIALAFLCIFVTCSLTYRSLVAGFLFVVPLALSNLLTFAYMGWRGIGLNVNSLPVASLGIGLGVDYGIYVVSRIMEETKKTGSVPEAIERAITTAGRAVLVTAATMGGGVIFWYFLSDVRFQAEMGLLLALWMVVSMLGGMILIPALIRTLQPRFVYRLARQSSDQHRVEPIRRKGITS